MFDQKLEDLSRFKNNQLVFDEDYMSNFQQTLRRKNITLTYYEDGRTRKFGQRLKPQHYEEVPGCDQKGEFIYEIKEGGENRKKRRVQKRPRSKDNTRSLYDDPQLQQIKNYQTKKLLQEINNTGQNSTKVSSDFVNWIPITSQDIFFYYIQRTAEVPSSFYMNEPYSSQSGPSNIDSNTIKDEYDAFRLFFDNEIYETILKNTLDKNYNRYLNQVYKYCNGLIQRRPSLYQFELSKHKLEGYFAIQLFFGIVRLTNYRDYWPAEQNELIKGRKLNKLCSNMNNNEKKVQFRNRYSINIVQRLSAIMTYNYFSKLRMNLSINNSNEESKKQAFNDPIWKVRDFLNKMNLRFQKFYNPGEYLAIDEGIIPFNGKINFKVYNPDKPNKWGIKEFLLCDAITSYTLQIKLYHGQTMWSKEFGENIDFNIDSNQSKMMELVLSMLKNYENKQHKVVMDNYYTSWKLFRELKNRGFGALGTIRHNRTGLTKEDLVSSHFQQIYQNSTYVFYINENKDCILLYFQGTSDKEVALISSFIDNSYNESHQWEITKIAPCTPNPRQPYMVHIYNKYHGGVDRRNSYVGHYRAKFKNTKWWRSVYDRLFETVILNAYIIHKCYRAPKYQSPLKSFRTNLMQILSERSKAQCAAFEKDNFKNYQRDFWKNDHYFLEGEEIAECIECGSFTKQLQNLFINIMSQVVNNVLSKALR